MRAFMSDATRRLRASDGQRVAATLPADARGTDRAVLDMLHAEREARRILAETEPGFLLSGDHRSTTTAANWASEAAYVGRYFTPCDHYRDMGDCWIAVPWEGNAHAALAESLAAFVEGR